MHLKDLARSVRTMRAVRAADWVQPHASRALMPLAGVAVLLVALLSIGIGSVAIPPLTTLKILLARLPLLPIAADWSSTTETIVLNIRLPRVVLVALSGTALASSGAAYQALFRNPLADPYLIGVSAGAGLGAITALALQMVYPVIGALAVPVGAFSGALLTVTLVYRLGRIGRSTPMTTLILAGVAIGTLASALTTFILLSISEQAVRVLAFLLGGYGSAGWRAVLTVAPVVGLGVTVLYLYARPLNLLLFDEEQAQQLGVNVERVKLIVVVAATLMTAAAVAFSGLIGFVGLIVPHIARLLGGADHRRLLPLAALGGAAFMMLADMIARTVIAPRELPLGIVTALAGAPFFLYLLRRAKRATFF